LKDSAGQPDALIQELDRAPEVEFQSFWDKKRSLAHLKEDLRDNPELFAQLDTKPTRASLEIWLTDYHQSAEFAEKLKAHPEVDDVKVPSTDFVFWTSLLRGMSHPK
jgi:cell division protein FtsX